jgi:hypothetical protein
MSFGQHGPGVAKTALGWLIVTLSSRKTQQVLSSSGMEQVGCTFQSGVSPEGLVGL